MNGLFGATGQKSAAARAPLMPVDLRFGAWAKPSGQLPSPSFVCVKKSAFSWVMIVATLEQTRHPGPSREVLNGLWLESLLGSRILGFLINEPDQLINCITALSNALSLNGNIMPVNRV